MRIVVFGEAMIELSGSGHTLARRFGGDTLNTAVHLTRFGHDVAFATALGADPFSDYLRSALLAEGVDTSLIGTDPDRVVGLYAIKVDDMGERAFTYWRGESAARRMFSLPAIDETLAAAAMADVVIFSLISLAILPAEGRLRLLNTCRQVRDRGGRVVFDGNYRPKLWGDLAAAKDARTAALAVTDIGLPTLEDEVALGSPQDLDAIAKLWTAQGTGEVVVKLGAAGCFIDGVVIPPPLVMRPVDTSGAGDAFNAGYIHARMAGASRHDAALLGHQTAGWTIERAGSIPERDRNEPYRSVPKNLYM